VDVGERLEHAVVDDPRDAFALVEPLALEEHLLLLLETAAGEVDGQPDEPAEEEQQHDVVDRGLGGGAHLDEVGDRDDRRGQEAAPGPGDHRAAGDRAGSPDRGDRELPGGDRLGRLGEHRREHPDDGDRHLDDDDPDAASPVEQQPHRPGEHDAEDDRGHPGPHHRLLPLPGQPHGIQRSKGTEDVEPPVERLDDDGLTPAGPR
jgi:hypothetical protein